MMPVVSLCSGLPLGRRVRASRRAIAQDRRAAGEGDADGKKKKRRRCDDGGGGGGAPFLSSTGRGDERTTMTTPHPHDVW